MNIFLGDTLERRLLRMIILKFICIVRWRRWIWGRSTVVNSNWFGVVCSIKWNASNWCFLNLNLFSRSSDSHLCSYHWSYTTHRLWLLKLLTCDSSLHHLRSWHLPEYHSLIILAVLIWGITISLRILLSLINVFLHVLETYLLRRTSWSLSLMHKCSLVLLHEILYLCIILSWFMAMIA